MSANEWLLLLCLLLSGFFSGMEIAFVSSNRLKQELDLKATNSSGKGSFCFLYQSFPFYWSLVAG